MAAVGRLSRLAPEEIAGFVLLAVVLVFVAARPATVTQLFQSPYATPAPGGGPAHEVVPGATASPASGLIELVPAGTVRSIRIGTSDGRTIVHLPSSVPSTPR